MSELTRVVRNAIILGGQQVIVNLLSIVVVAYVARELGVTDYGIFSLSFTFATVFSFLSNLGLRTLTIREVARERENAFGFIGKIIPARIILIVVSSCSMPLSAFLLNYEAEVVLVVAIASLMALFDQLSRVISDIFQAFEEMGGVAIRDIVVRICTGGLAILVLFFKYGLVMVCWMYVFGTLLGFFLNLTLYLKRFPVPRFNFDFHFIKSAISESVGYMLIGLASTLYCRVDVFMLSKMSGYDSVGIYNASANLFYRMNVIADAIATASFPALAQLYWVNKEKASTVVSVALLMAFAIGLPMAVGGMILSSSLISLIYGNEFNKSIPVFFILSSSLPLMFVSLQINYALGAIKKQNIVLSVVTFLLLCNVVMNSILIEIYSVNGAALATFITEIVSVVSFCYIGSRYFNINLPKRMVFSVLASTLVMGVVVNEARTFHTIFAVAIGAFTYLIILVILGGKGIIKQFVVSLKG